jgi:hypothetical protein
VVIDDPARLRLVAEILRAATEILPNHPHSRWTANMEMVTRDGTYYFSVNGRRRDIPTACWSLRGRKSEEDGTWATGRLLQTRQSTPMHFNSIVRPLVPIMTDLAAAGSLPG